MVTHAVAGLDHADLHGVGSLLAQAARLIRERGHNPVPCPASDSYCTDPGRGNGRLCAACAVALAVEQHQGPPTDPVDAYHVTWRRWRRRGTVATRVAHACNRTAAPAAALAAVAAGINRTTTVASAPATRTEPTDSPHTGRTPP
jgi:hypothetical protein